MENEDLMKVVTEKANMWLGEGYDDATKAEVKRMLEADDKTELIDSFYRDLEFGTGGLRWAPRARGKLPAPVTCRRR